MVNVRRVKLDGGSNKAGTVVGAGVGGYAASKFGGLMTTIAGVLGGGVLGYETQKHVANKPQKALQITVRGPHGRLHTIVQPSDGTVYRDGERVLVVQGRQHARVEPWPHQEAAKK